MDTNALPPLPVISIVGRPNVGKSSLFNRILRKRIAVVDDVAGVTRDRNYMKTVWNGVEFTLVDTGGLIPNLREAIPEAIHEQVDIAMRESAVILFMVELGTGITDFDQIIARQLRRSFASRTILVVNKAESAKAVYEVPSYMQLGLGKPYATSALHGKGVGDLLDEIVARINDDINSSGTDDEQEPMPEIDGLKVAIVGRPNAGKSSLVNKLLKQNRMIVDSKPGTTRDAIDSLLDFGDKKIILIDTAGLRKKARVKKNDLEYYSNMRAIDSIGRCDICVLVIDVNVGMGVQDMRILRKIFEERKGVVVVWNKWDILEKDHKTFDNLVAEAREEYQELKNVPMISLSALTGQRVSSLMDKVFEVEERMGVNVGGAEFENLVFDWVRAHPHPVTPGSEVRFLGAKQVNATFPCFRFFVTHPDMINPGYERFLANKIYEKYNFCGCPLVLEFRPIARKRGGNKIDDVDNDNVDM
ncbi:MAG: ribosome biogenesis GTPase Der [Chitinispirillales bacterium]|jgi:GTP-binding protein|nr:ribosome biogenesis GTPase Der [Chitinispirillales bacterium]